MKVTCIHPSIQHVQGDEWKRVKMLFECTYIKACVWVPAYMSNVPEKKQRERERGCELIEEKRNDRQEEDELVNK